MAQSADLKAKIEGLNKVFQFYYKENFKTLRKAISTFLGLSEEKNAWKNFKNSTFPSRLLSF